MQNLNVLFLVTFMLCTSFVSAQGSGNALDFDGANNGDYVSATGYDVDIADFTVEAWINPDSDAKSGIIVQGGYSYLQGFLLDFNPSGSSGTLRLETAKTGNVGNGSVSADNVISTGEWQHISASVTRGSSGNLTKLYVNGVEVASEIFQMVI